MRKRIPLVLMVSGLCLIAGGFLYDVGFAGIPYQDPTPELRAKYDYHAKIASKMMHAGTYAFAGGFVSFCVLAMIKKKEPNQTPEPTTPARPLATTQGRVDTLDDLRGRGSS